ncbi:YceI family protein [Actinomadura luzonensis]|uniref:YceI family protein n=1 Tax=Actinomadura luzonensis TaxID=2805427 RepID=UPI003898F9FF
MATSPRSSSPACSSRNCAPSSACSADATSTGVKHLGDACFEVTGRLTVRGVTREITVPLRYAGSTVINRKERLRRRHPPRRHRLRRPRPAHRPRRPGTADPRSGVRPTTAGCCG